MQFEVIDDFIGVLAIKLNECQRGRPGLFFLLVQKCIEAADRIIANRLYGPCPIKNDSNVRVVVFHCIPPTVSCRFRRGTHLAPTSSRFRLSRSKS